MFDMSQRAIARIIHISSVTCTFFKKKRKKRKFTIRTQPIDSVSLTLSPDACHAVVNNSSGGFSMYSLRDGELVHLFHNENDRAKNAVLPASFVHKGRALMTASSNGNISIWDVGTGIIIDTLEHRHDCK